MNSTIKCKTWEIYWRLVWINRSSGFPLVFLHTKWIKRLHSSQASVRRSNEAWTFLLATDELVNRWVSRRPDHSASGWSYLKMSAKLIVCLVSLTLKIATAEPQEIREVLRNFENLETLPIRAISNFLNPQARPTQDRAQLYHISGAEPVYHEIVYEKPSQVQPNTQNQVYPSSNSDSCGSFWSIHRDYELFGILTVPNPDRMRSVIRVQLALGARLPSVSSTENFQRVLVEDEDLGKKRRQTEKSTEIKRSSNESYYRMMQCAGQFNWYLNDFWELFLTDDECSLRTIEKSALPRLPE